MTGQQKTRGIRNNNPLNIVISNNPWRGKLVANTDGTFEQFSSVLFGIRAALVLIRTYIERHGLRTIDAIVRRWCPEPDAQKTALYIVFVESVTGIHREQVLRFDDEQTICRVAQAMARFETGELLPLQLFRSAYSLIVLEAVQGTTT